MIDYICLWIGRIIIGIGISFFTLGLLWYSRILFRRPYYSIKWLLPWNWFDILEWEELVFRIKNANFNINSTNLADRAKIYQCGKHFAILKDCGKHNWQNPTYRFYFIKK